YNFIDTFRYIHPLLKTYTWQNSRTSKSRIDQIWILPSSNWLLYKADIIPSDPNILPTDHHFAQCTIETLFLSSNTQTPRLIKPNNRFDWQHTSSAQWQAFDQYIFTHLSKHNTPIQSIPPSNTN